MRIRTKTQRAQYTHTSILSAAFPFYNRSIERPSTSSWQENILYAETTLKCCINTCTGVTLSFWHSGSHTNIRTHRHAHNEMHALVSVCVRYTDYFNQQAGYTINSKSTNSSLIVRYKDESILVSTLNVVFLWAPFTSNAPIYMISTCIDPAFFHLLSFYRVYSSVGCRFQHLCKLRLAFYLRTGRFMSFRVECMHLHVVGKTKECDNCTQWNANFSANGSLAHSIKLIGCLKNGWAGFGSFRLPLTYTERLVYDHAKHIERHMWHMK